MDHAHDVVGGSSGVAASSSASASSSAPARGGEKAGEGGDGVENEEVEDPTTTTVPAPALWLAPGAAACLRAEALEWGAVHGLWMRDRTTGALCPAPVTLVPAPFPRRAFATALALAPDFAALARAVSLDTRFLRETLAPAAAQDPSFTRPLLDLLAARRRHPRRCLAVTRSDYMLHCPRGCAFADAELRQVELNTIAASFSNLARLAADLHRFLAAWAARCGGGTLPAPARCLRAEDLPPNDGVLEIPRALAAAWELYGNRAACVAFVVHAAETNVVDQKWMEYLLWERHGVPSVRVTLREIAEAGRLAGDGELSVRGTPIAVAYLRAGYGPEDYPGRAEWEGRRMLEASRAFCCPTVALQLAGSKKVQEVLARPGVAERFCADAAAAARVRATFAGLHSLTPGDPGAEAAVARARAEPHAFVLKPQREGGGHNLYGAALAAELARLAPDERQRYILMDRLLPPEFPTHMLRGADGELVSAVASAELGVFGVALWDDDDDDGGGGGGPVFNRAAGHLVRTKVAAADDGGVAAGIAVLDSPWLCDGGEGEDDAGRG